MVDGYLNKPLFKKIFVDHICSDIRWAIDAKRELAAAQLLLAAIDTTSGLERPAKQEDTIRQQFIAWADKYLALQGEHYTLAGIDVYGSRRGFLHGYTSQARVVRNGEAKMLSYVDAIDPPVASEREPGLVLVSLRHLFEAYMAGLIDTMKRINQSEELAALVNPRLEMMFCTELLDESGNIKK